MWLQLWLLLRRQQRRLRTRGFAGSGRCLHRCTRLRTVSGAGILRLGLTV